MNNACQSSPWSMHIQYGRYKGVESHFVTHISERRGLQNHNKWSVFILDDDFFRIKNHFYCRTALGKSVKPTLFTCILTFRPDSFFVTVFHSNAPNKFQCFQPNEHVFRNKNSNLINWTIKRNQSKPFDSTCGQFDNIITTK